MQPLRLAAAALLAFSPLIASAQTAPPPPAAQEQAPGVFRMPLGDFMITALSDGTVPQNMYELLKGIDQPETDRLLRRGFLTNPVEASINAFLIDTGRERILIDTGAGERFASIGGGKLIRSLAAAGVKPEQIDHIVLTHVHTDHSGGLTVGGRMIFPRAIVHAPQADLDFFLNPANPARLTYGQRYFDEAQATIAPYVRAGRVRGFTGVTQLLPGVTAIPTPGHTPGHAFHRVKSRGQSIEFWGDIMHFGTVQFARPQTTVTYDVDASAAAAQRARQFRRGEQERRLVAFAHVNFPGIGHLRKEGSGYAWEPIEYRDKPVSRE